MNDPYMTAQMPLMMSAYPQTYPGQQDATIFEKRLEHDQVIFEIYKVLTGKQSVKNPVTGKIEEVQLHTPLMNDSGVRSVLSMLRSVLNPVTGLTNIDENHASSLLKMIWRSMLYIVVMKDKEYEIDRHHKQLIMTEVVTICHCQLYRGVGGHESKSLRTTTNEQIQTGHQTMVSGGGFSLNPFARKG